MWRTRGGRGPGAAPHVYTRVKSTPPRTASPPSTSSPQRPGHSDLSPPRNGSNTHNVISLPLFPCLLLLTGTEWPTSHGHPPSFGTYVLLPPKPPNHTTSPYLGSVAHVVAVGLLESCHVVGPAAQGPQVHLQRRTVWRVGGVGAGGGVEAGVGVGAGVGIASTVTGGSGGLPHTEAYTHARILSNSGVWTRLFPFRCPTHAAPPLTHTHTTLSCTLKMSNSGHSWNLSPGTA